MYTRSLSLFEDGELWRTPCAVSSDEVPCVMLIDDAGVILWMQSAPVTDALVDDLRSRYRERPTNGN